MNDAAGRARSLHGEIRSILLQEWDPIGIRDVKEAQDEYDGYVPTLFAMIVSRKPVHEVCQYLLWLETEHMGLFADKQRTQAIAEKLVELTR